MLSPDTIKQALKTEAKNLGFVLFGCSGPLVSVDSERYETWIEQGFGEGMPYLGQPGSRLARKNPAALLPEVKTVISLAVPYPLLGVETARLDNSAIGRLASYACYEDYHLALGGMAQTLALKLEILAPGIKTRVCVDIAPILEKAYAHQAGLGWIGQNTLLFNPEYGSRLLLAEILTTLELPADQPLAGDPCANCNLCLKSCPTGALLGNRSMDARHCLSFLTIENRAEIPVPFRHTMDSHVFGCDGCQQACPYNKLPFPDDIRLPLSAQISSSVDLRTELKLVAEDFKTKYADTPVLRAKHAGFLRNLIIAAANSGDCSLLPQLQTLKSEHPNPMLQETLDWAFSVLEIPSSAR